MNYWQRLGIAFAALALILAGTARATEAGPAGTRADISLDLPIWPALNDLDPVSPGSFDATGLGIGASVHWPVSQLAGSDLLLGIDGMIAATDSSISGAFADVLARQLYLGCSVKWLLGDSRSVSLDAGIGYHEIDMAQVDTDWWGSFEFEQFSDSAAGGFIGGTWDIGAGRPDRAGGLMLAVRVHFTDFGTVFDEASFVSSVLGPDAGTLDGPMYVLRIGYSMR